MAEYDKERLYYLKLPKDFFNSYYVKILEGMPNGKDYLLMYLKLMCESISHNGYLRFSKDIPYTAEMISVVTNTNVDVVRNGLKALERLEMVSTTQDGSLRLPKVPEMTGSQTVGARKKEIQIKSRVEKIPPPGGKNSTEIEIDKEIDIDIDTNKGVEGEKGQAPTIEDSDDGEDGSLPYISPTLRDYMRRNNLSTLEEAKDFMSGKKGD